MIRHDTGSSTPPISKPVTRWDDYMGGLAGGIERTSTSIAPWYLIPADKRWYSRMVVSELLRTTMKNFNQTWPATRRRP